MNISVLIEKWPRKADRIDEHRLKCKDACIERTNFFRKRTYNVREQFLILF